MAQAKGFFFLWLNLDPSLKGTEFVFVYTPGESHTMHSYISHDSKKTKKENPIKTNNLRSIQVEEEKLKEDFMNSWLSE